MACLHSREMAAASADLCPITGRGRLSYEQAEYLFKQNLSR